MADARRALRHAVEVLGPHQQVDVAERAERGVAVVEVRDSAPLQHPEGDVDRLEMVGSGQEQRLQDEALDHRAGVQRRALLRAGLPVTGIDPRSMAASSRPLVRACAVRVEQLPPSVVRQRAGRELDERAREADRGDGIDELVVLRDHGRNTSTAPSDPRSASTGRMASSTPWPAVRSAARARRGRRRASWARPGRPTGRGRPHHRHGTLGAGRQDEDAVACGPPAAHRPPGGSAPARRRTISSTRCCSQRHDGFSIAGARRRCGRRTAALPAG